MKRRLDLVGGGFIEVQISDERKEFCYHDGYIEKRQESWKCTNCGKEWFEVDDLVRGLGR